MTLNFPVSWISSFYTESNMLLWTRPVFYICITLNVLCTQTLYLCTYTTDLPCKPPAGLLQLTSCLLIYFSYKNTHNTVVWQYGVSYTEHVYTQTESQLLVHIYVFWVTTLSLCVFVNWTDCTEKHTACWSHCRRKTHPGVAVLKKVILTGCCHCGRGYYRLVRIKALNVQLSVWISNLWDQIPCLWNRNGIYTKPRKERSSKV